MFYGYRFATVSLTAKPVWNNKNIHNPITVSKCLKRRLKFKRQKRVCVTLFQTLPASHLAVIAAAAATATAWAAAAATATAWAAAAATATAWEHPAMLVAIRVEMNRMIWVMF